MKLINANPIFNLTNHGFVYVCKADDDTFWVRSTAGKWVQIKTSNPMDFDSIAHDFDLYIESLAIATENDVKVDNSGQDVVDPIKYIPPPPPEPPPEPPLEPI